jgi:hypothetical protein
MNCGPPYLLVGYLLSSFNKQHRLASLVGEYKWQFDVPTGTLSFGNDLHWHAQILGTESHETNTWLLAWANTGSNLLPALIQASLQMKQLGEQQQIPELTEPQIPLTDEVNGHVFSMIASGVCDADAYYRGPYDGGAVFLLIKDDKFPRNKEPPLARLAHVFPQAISAFSIPDHKLALTSYLDQHGIAYQTADNAIVVKEDDAPILTATFGERNRLVKLESVLTGSA